MPAANYVPVARPSKLAVGLVGIVCFLVLLLCAASIALFGLFGAAFWFVVIAAPLTLLVLAIFPQVGRDLLFYAALAGFIGLPVVNKITGFSGSGLWQILVFATALLGVPALVRTIARSRLLVAATVSFTLFLCLALVSTYFGRSRASAAVYQFISDWKPFVLLAFGLAIAWKPPTQRLFWLVVHWFWLWELVFVVFGWAAPGIYQKVFPVPGAYWHDPSGIFTGRALGPFVHPSMLATVSAFFGLVCVARACVPLERRWKYALLALMYFFLVFCAVQRQEAVAFVLSAAFAIVISRPDQLGRRAIIALLTVAAAGLFLWLAFSDFTLRDAQSWGLNSTGSWDNPRALLYYGAYIVARLYFPIGAGLGTYGGAGAMKFDLSLYDELGYRNYWWFQDEQFLMDTYWPNSLAEAGFFGAGLLFLFYCLVLLYGVARALRAQMPARMYWIIFSSSIAYMLMLTITSPAFQDTSLYFLPALMFGIAAKLETQQAGTEVRAKAKSARMFALAASR